MHRDVLTTLLNGNQAHVESRPADYFDEVQDEQHPAAVSICCADSRVAQEGMFDIDGPGWLFTPSNIGNQAWDVVDGERVVNGNVLYPIEYTGTKTVAVVGHTGCGAVTAAYRAASGPASTHPRGIAKWIDSLGSVIEDGLDAVDTDGDETAIVNRLVEYNVDRQVAYLQHAEDVPDDVSVYGFVYDLHGVYGGPRGQTYLVNDDGETDPDAIRDALDESHAEYATRLTS